MQNLTTGLNLVGRLLNFENAGGGAGNDQLLGNDLDNWLSGGEGDDRIEGGEGDDTILDGPGKNLLFGGPGDDTFFVVGWPDEVYGGDGMDTVVVSIHNLWGQLWDSIERFIYLHVRRPGNPSRLIPIINVESGEVVGITFPFGVILRLPNGDETYFGLGAGDQASLTTVLRPELPGDLPAGFTAQSAMRVRVWHASREFAHRTLMRVSFIIPAELSHLEFAILFWDASANNGAGGWVEVDSYRTTASYLNQTVERQEAWVDQTGIYVLAVKTILP